MTMMSARLPTLVFVALAAASALIVASVAHAQDEGRDEDLARAVVGPVAGQGAVPAAPVTAPPPVGYCARRLGAWFYCETPAPPPDDSRAAALQEAAPSELAEVEAYQKRVDAALKVASWNPTPENVQRYIELQRVALDKGSMFSDVWRRLIWTTPALDYTLQRPTTSLAKTESDNERSQDRDIFLREVSPEVGVFYVYSGTCGPCRVASPIIKSFADRFGVPVRVISTDGAPNPVFGTTYPDHGQLAGWGIDSAVTPALLIFQAPAKFGRDGERILHLVATADGRQLRLRPCLQARGCLTYLGAGVMSVEDIAERAFVLLSKDPGTDY